MTIVVLICACQSAKKNQIITDDSASDSTMMDLLNNDDSNEQEGGDHQDSNNQDSDNVDQIVALASCTYTNLFSSEKECKAYYGSGWSAESAEENCLGEQEAIFTLNDNCQQNSFLGYCYIDEDKPQAYRLTFPGNEVNACGSTQQGCVLFANGRFVPSDVCNDAINDIPMTEGIGSGGSVYQPFEYICKDDTEDESVCMWQAIGGCAPEGSLFTDFASCTPILTQRPYIPVPPSGFKTQDDDPIRQNEDFWEDLQWAQKQAESCGCICCHSQTVAPRGASIWDTQAGDIWTDTFTSKGLAQAAGWIDTSSLGAFDAEDNQGFDRSITVLPTTDIERMKNFFEGELARRGYDKADFAEATPVGGPLYTQRQYQPERCMNGEGVTGDQVITWKGGAARYLYVLQAGSDNPSTPPNLDLPEGTLWRIDADYRYDGFGSGIQYGQIPTNSKQSYPEQVQPTSLQDGVEYYLYVLRDLAIPITRCLFVYDDTSSTANSTNTLWNQVCTSDDDCNQDGFLCSKSPTDEQGYCSMHCQSKATCEQANAPAGWTCNAIRCDVESLTWCGPADEVTQSDLIRSCE